MSLFLDVRSPRPLPAQRQHAPLRFARRVASASAALVEPFECRTLFAHIGLDRDFGELGSAPVGATALLTDVAGGKVLAVSQRAALRLNPNGSIDSTFVDEGAAPESRTISDAVISGARLIIGGRAGGSGEVYLRAIDLETGAVDSSFGTGGIFTFIVEPVSTEFQLRQTSLTSMIVTSDGGIVLATSQYLERPTSPFTHYGDVLYKLTPGGAFDPGFGDNGAMQVNDGDAELFPYLTAIPAGGFFLIGPQAPLAVLQRRNNDGTLDDTFGDNGSIDLGGGFLFSGRGVLQPDGKLLIPVDNNQDSGTSASITRRNADGTRDTSFGGGGFVPLGPGHAREIAVDSEGRIVGVFGDRLYRLLPDGTFDSDFDDDGLAPLDEGTPLFVVDVDDQQRALMANHDQVVRFTTTEGIELDADGFVRIEGNDSADTIRASRAGDVITVGFNAETRTFDADEIAGIRIDALDGDDVVEIDVDLKATVYGGLGNDSIGTGDAPDRIRPDDGNDTVNAGGGNDAIFDGGGDNRISGGDGDDSIQTGGGADAIFGDRGDDTVKAGFGDDRISGGAGRDNLFGQQGNDRISGTNHSDALDGGPDNDVLLGLNGNDKLFGADGSDTLDGGTGADLFDAGNLHDLLRAADGARDTVFAGGGRDRGEVDDDVDLVEGLEESI